MQKHILLTACTIAGTAWASGLPPLGGPMNHVLIELTFNDGFVIVTEEPGPMTLVGSDEPFGGAAEVLNGSRFNAQYGWLVSGLWAPPPAGSGIFIEAVETDPGLLFYAGRAFGDVAFMDPIHGTDGTDGAFRWDGGMLHNYAAAAAPGVYRATFRVYSGGMNGEPMTEPEPGLIELSWAWTTDCPADLAAPFGVLDLSDLTTFAQAFVDGSPAADLAPPARVLDLADIVGFVDAFTAGCP